MIDKKDSGISLTPPEPMTKENINKFIVSDDELRQRIINGEYRVGKFDLLNRSTWKQTDGTMYKRKGKKRTTDPDEYILAHDLEKKAPRNISVRRLKWFSVGKKVYKINRLELNEDITIVMFDKVKFNALKTLMTKGDINE